MRSFAAPSRRDEANPVRLRPRHRRRAAGRPRSIFCRPRRAFRRTPRTRGGSGGFHYEKKRSDWLDVLTKGWPRGKGGLADRGWALGTRLPRNPGRRRGLGGLTVRLRGGGDRSLARRRPRARRDRRGRPSRIRERGPPSPRRDGARRGRAGQETREGRRRPRRRTPIRPRRRGSRPRSCAPQPPALG